MPMTREEVLDVMERHFGAPDEWRESKDGFYSLGSYAFGATIEPYYDKFLVRVGRSIGWGQDPNVLIARVEFDTLEEAKNFGMLIYRQNKPDTIDRTRVRGYPI